MADNLVEFTADRIVLIATFAGTCVGEFNPGHSFDRDEDKIFVIRIVGLWPNRVDRFDGSTGFRPEPAAPWHTVLLTWKVEPFAFYGSTRELSAVSLTEAAV